MNMYFMYVVQYMKVCLKKNAINSSTQTLQSKYFIIKSYAPNILIMLRKFYWVQFYFHIDSVDFSGFVSKTRGCNFFFNSDSLCQKPSIPTCLSTFNPEVTLSCFYQWSEWWWQIFSLVFMCGTHLFKKLLLLLLVVVVVVSF